MKFKGTPGLTVIDAKTHKKIGTFNDCGVMEVTDSKLFLRLKYKFPVFDEFVCSKCGAKFESKGYLLAHHRAEHKEQK